MQDMSPQTSHAAQTLAAVPAADLLHHVRGVIFDMDGLLLDSERVAYRIGREASEHLGAPWRHEVAMQLIGLNSLDGYRLMQEAFGQHFPVAAHQAEFSRRYEQAIDEGRFDLKPGVHALLDRLDALNLPRVVATSTRQVRAQAKLGGVGVFPRLNGLIGGDQVSRGKPAPDIYWAAAALIQVPIEACLVLEDSNIGVQGGLASGAQVVMVPDLLTPGPQVLAAGVRVLDSLERLVPHPHRA